jgi:serine/threonine-protein kinase
MSASVPPSVDLREGQMLAGKYRVERILGRGGMGMVVRARHVQLDEPVAVKLMLPEVAQSPEAVARFTREARAAAKIKSEHVVRVSDVATLEDGSPYMVMEFLEGRDLESLVHERKRLPVDEAIEYFLQACEAIAEAHSLGIVHRDLKPANLFLGSRRDGSPIVKVLDFGISKVSSTTGSSDGAMTRTSAIMGSPLYMSPEQMTSSRDVDARSDIWALGVILYELLSGAQPFTGETLPQVCAQVLEAKPARLGSLVPGLPNGLEAAVHRCLEKQPAMRYGTVAELARALVPYASSRARLSVDRISTAFGAGALPPPAESLAGEATSASMTESPWAKSRVSSKRRPAWAFVAALAVAAVAGAALFLNRSSPPAPVLSAAPSAPVAAAPAPLESVAPVAGDTAAPPHEAPPTAFAEPPAPALASASPITPSPRRPPTSRVRVEAHAPAARAPTAAVVPAPAAPTPPTPAPAEPKPQPAAPPPPEKKIDFGGRL